MTRRTTEARAEAAAARAAGPEIAGWCIALVVSVGVVAWVATRSDWLMFTDGDSVLVPMIVRSLALGQPQDWAMSPVLFLPETAGYALLSTFGLGMRATLILNGVVNLLLLYGAARLVAGRRGPGRRPVFGAVLAFVAFGLLVVLEGAASLPGFQLATLLATTTYYSATVVASVATIGLTRRVLDGAPPIIPVVALAVLSAVSVLTNPLFVAWAAGPVSAALLALLLARRIPRRPALLLTGALVVGVGAGFAARGLFAGAIVAADGNYVRGERWAASAEYFATVTAQSAQTWHGMLWLVVIAALTVSAALVASRAWRRHDAPVALVGLVSAATPLIVTLGVIALGSDADRYLQPWVFLPVLALAVAPPRSPGRSRVAVAGGVLAVAVVLGVAVPATVAAATRVDRDVSCVVDWVEASGRTGAGQFWTVRAPKLALDDPARLIQVDHTLRSYEWLVNRTDSAGAEITFLVQDASSTPFALPAGFSLDDADAVPCGRYTLYDFGTRVLPLGPARN